MDYFPKIKASNNSLANRKFGYGINDALFKVKPTINGKQVCYQPYRIWTHMLERCYSAKLHERNPTYIDCIVCAEWLTFSVFETWMLTQDWKGMALDKDIIKQGNRVYCPDFCRFVSQALNSLLNGNAAARGSLPLGVSWHKRDKAYQTRINICGKLKHLGNFKTVQEAKAAYNNAKYAEIHRQAMMQTDPEIKAGLMNWRVEQ